MTSMIRNAPLTLLASLVAGCGVTKLDIDPDGGGSGIPPEVQQHFTASCALGTACHASGGVSPALDSGSLDAVLAESSQGIPYVDPGNPQTSYLLIKMMEVPGATVQRVADPMPPFGALTPEAQINIYAWVAGFPFDPGNAGSTGGDPTGNSDESTGGDMPTGDSTGDPGGAAICSLEATDPDAIGAIDYGDDDAQIPEAVGLALESNCSCHYTDSDPPAGAGYGDYPDDSLRMTTAAEVQAELDKIQSRVPDGNMPPTGCMISDDDVDLLVDWLKQGAPANSDYAAPE